MKKLIRALGCFFILPLLICLTNLHAAPASLDASSSTNLSNNSNKQFVYVDGEVQKPGRYDWFSGMTVIDAINAAGGLKKPAGHHTQIIRTDGKRFIFDADTFPYGQKPLPQLAEGSIVNVPLKLPKTGASEIKPLTP